VVQPRVLAPVALYCLNELVPLHNLCQSKLPLFWQARPQHYEYDYVYLILNFFFTINHLDHYWYDLATKNALNSQIFSTIVLLNHS
jgi:hypothetical protein